MIKYNLTLPQHSTSNEFAPLINNLSLIKQRIIGDRLKGEEQATELAIEFAHYVDKQLALLEHNLNMLRRVQDKTLRQTQAEVAIYMFVSSLQAWQEVNSKIFLHSAILSHANLLQDIYVGENIGLIAEPTGFDNSEWFEKTYPERIVDNANGLYRVLSEEFVDLISKDEPIDFLFDDLSSIEKISYGIYSFHRLIVGEIYRAKTYTEREIYSELDELGYINEYEWVSVLDKNTCADCESLDGNIYVGDTLGELPPLHAWCRCVVIGRA